MNRTDVRNRQAMELLRTGAVSVADIESGALSLQDAINELMDN